MPHELSALNDETAANWEWFATHRARLTGLVTRACHSRADRIGVLGAGNCNDIDLAEALRYAGHIGLVDMDADALVQGVARQELARSDRITLHGGADITGARDCIDGWDRRAPSPGQIEIFRRRLAIVPRIPLAGECDVAVSSCVLSALISSVVQALGAEHPQTVDLIMKIRDQHLLVLAAHAKPGGRALLVSDLVSSDTCPELLDAPDVALPSLMAQALADRNFFTGANPVVAIHRLRILAARTVREVRLIAPWRWRLSDTRAYLVYGIAFTRI